jgi:hypothetical protein
MLTAHKSLLAAALLPLVTACDPAESGPAIDDDVEFRCHWTNPNCDTSNTPFTGLVIGLSLLDTTFAEHEGTQVHKLTLSGGIGLVDSFWAHEGQLFAQKGTTVYSGYTLDDAVFSLTVDGVPVEFKITAVVGPAPGNFYWHYTFTYKTDDMVVEKPACIPTDAPDFGAVVQSDLGVYPDTGDVSYRANTVFVACLRGALGEISYEPLGYGFRPWVTGLPVFEGATDMLRANYCDDGTPWTEYGNPLAQQNKYGIGNDVLVGGLDAVWTLDGAICLGETLRGGRKYDDIVCDNKPPKCTDAEGLARYQAEGRFITHTF